MPTASFITVLRRRDQFGQDAGECVEVLSIEALELGGRLVELALELRSGALALLS
jgi:hypothetical protein